MKEIPLMPSPAKNPTQWLTRVGLLTGFGLVLFLFESFLPRPLPWVKPGLANIATMVALYTLGGAAAWMVALLRCVLASLIGGSLLSPTFWLSISGSSAAVLVMSSVRHFGRRMFSVVGIGLVGAVAHVLGQLAVVGTFIVRDAKIFILLPTMLLSSVLTGLIVGYASYLIVERIAPTAVSPMKEFSSTGTDDGDPAFLIRHQQHSISTRTSVVERYGPIL